MSGHTPGPWRVNWLFTAPDESQYDILAPRNDTTKYTHQVVCTMRATAANAEANARLIAAAPELLAALKEAWGKLYLLRLHVLNKEVSADLSASLDSSAAAIAKAEGRS